MENMKELVEKFEREYGEEAKELRQQEQKKKRNLAGNYLGNLRQNYYIDKEKKIQKRKGKEIGQELE